MNFYFPFSVKQMKKKNWFGIFPKLVRQNNFVIFSFSIAEPHLNAISFGLNPTNDFGFFFFGILIEIQKEYLKRKNMWKQMIAIPQFLVEILGIVSIEKKNCSGSMVSLPRTKRAEMNSL